MLAVLLRASEHDVLGTFVNGKLAYSTETLSGRTTVTNIPGTNGHVNGHHAPAPAAPAPAASAPAAGLSYPNKTPDVPLERPETASGCEFDSLEDAIKDIGACVRQRAQEGQGRLAHARARARAGARAKV